MSKYSVVIIYTKKGNLLDYFNDSQEINYCVSQADYQRKRDYYAREREIQLIAMFRFDGCKAFCKIKCPVNPLPVKGEFEVPSMNVLDRFLQKNGWSFKQKLYPRMFE